MNFKPKRVADFTEVVTGGTPSTAKAEYWDGNIPWLNSGSLNDGDIYEPSKCISELGLKNSAARLMPKDSILIALTGATTGQVGYLHIEASANQSVTGILPSQNHFPRYIYYYLKTQRKKIQGDAFGGAQPHINQQYVKDIIIPLPPLDDQIRIATVLTRAEQLIAKRKDSIQALDELLKSTFLEMFGDPVRNEKGWDRQLMGKLTVDNINYGIVQPGNDRSSGIPVIRVGDFRGFDIDDSNLKVVEEEISTKHKNSILVGDEILLACVGATIGKVALVSQRHSGHNIVRATARIRPKSNLNRYYLAYYMSAEFAQHYFKKAIRTVGQPTLNIKQITELPVILPPLPLQSQFAAIVEKVEALKTKYQQSLAELENLYGSLSQRAFKGELDLSGVRV